MKEVTIIGGGLAGAEAAWQVSKRGVSARLVEMRPVRQTPVHATDRLAELVCSNSLRSNHTTTAHGLLKEEMRRLGSLIMAAAEKARVPAGQALAVDRDVFSSAVTEAINHEPRIEIERREITTIPEEGTVIVASGPLTSEALSESIRAFTGESFLFFYDAISPIVEAETIDENIVFRASRYGKGGDDYLNCPMNEVEYRRFYEALTAAATIDIHDIDQAMFFESCLPIEVMARRGFDTLRFGPMKPVGLVEPRSGKIPFAVVQLRQDNLARSLYNIVGFQNQLKWGDQKRLLRLIPGLENAEFVRYGMIHRNTYINAPALLHATFQTRARTDLFFAGQLSGVEGYTESAASGLLAGINAAEVALGRKARTPPRNTSLGALAHYISHSETRSYQPTNISFGLLPPLDKRVRSKKDRKKVMVDRALAAIEVFSDGLREPSTAATELDAGETLPPEDECKKVSSA
jgi:methylenetetrahydrofolate--tRNA-(uracil-5-)-methyltransferase